MCVQALSNEAPRSKLRSITGHSFEDFSETELNPVASYGEWPSSRERLTLTISCASHRRRLHRVLAFRTRLRRIFSKGICNGQLSRLLLCQLVGKVLVKRFAPIAQKPRSHVSHV